MTRTRTFVAPVLSFPSSIEFDHAGIMPELSSGAEASPVPRFGWLRSAAWAFPDVQIKNTVVVLGIVLRVVCACCEILIDGNSHSCTGLRFQAACLVLMFCVFLASKLSLQIQFHAACCTQA